MQGLPGVFTDSLKTVTRCLDLGVVCNRRYPSKIIFYHPCSMHDTEHSKNAFWNFLEFSEQREAANFCFRGFESNK